ncbi:unnamed protein product [Lactuca virosa]|uniref:Uncharacterized protein n=1 Tax=Lactuca virosa TaxID=75947 RepID=A0AAU9N4U8_9ASTR|nr:unnamed protein product [Lactuca virosa]
MDVVKTLDLKNPIISNGRDSPPPLLSRRYIYLPAPLFVFLSLGIPRSEETQQTSVGKIARLPLTTIGSNPSTTYWLSVLVFTSVFISDNSLSLTIYQHVSGLCV